MEEVFAAGTAVVHIDDPTRIGITTGRTQKRGPILFVEVVFGSERASIRAEYLQLHSDTELPIEERIPTNRFGNADHPRRLLTSDKLRGSVHDSLYSMEAAR